jgi:Tfp pilus assembly protein PilV
MPNALWLQPDFHIADIPPGNPQHFSSPHDFAFMKRRTPSLIASGFSLVEVVVALGITTFCLIALMGLFSMGIGAGRESANELEASHIASSCINTRRASPSVDLGSDFPIPPLVSASSHPLTTVKLDVNGRVTSSSGAIRYGLQYRIESPAAGEKKPFKLYVCVFWPGQGTPQSATGRYETLSLLPPP